MSLRGFLGCQKAWFVCFFIIYYSPFEFPATEDALCNSERSLQKDFALPSDQNLVSFMPSISVMSLFYLQSRLNPLGLKFTFADFALLGLLNYVCF